MDLLIINYFDNFDKLNLNLKIKKNKMLCAWNKYHECEVDEICVCFKIYRWILISQMLSLKIHDALIKGCLLCIKLDREAIYKFTHKPGPPGLTNNNPKRIPELIENS